MSNCPHLEVPPLFFRSKCQVSSVSMAPRLLFQDFGIRKAGFLWWIGCDRWITGHTHKLQQPWSIPTRFEDNTFRNVSSGGSSTTHREMVQESPLGLNQKTPDVRLMHLCTSWPWLLYAFVVCFCSSSCNIIKPFPQIHVASWMMFHLDPSNSRDISQYRFL